MKKSKFLINGMRKHSLPWLMLAPFLILIVIFFFLPIILIAVNAFTDMDSALQWTFNGIDNFKKMLLDPNMPEILKNTFIYVFFTLAINVLFGLVLGLLTSYFIQKESVGLLFRTIWMLPRISPPVVYVLLWLWFFDPSPYGILNSLRALVDLPPGEWLSSNPKTAIVLANGMIGASFGMIIFSSAIKSIPENLFQAAKVDGASQWSIIQDIIIPAIRWPLMFVTMWQLLSLLTSYEYILLLTGGGPMVESEVLSLYSYHKAFESFEYGYGSAVSLVLVVIALGFSAIIWKVFGMKKMMGTSRVE
ncbi:sugar ABC transporter permease [Cytobacillus firmus]|uniref:carbohydrate ABC transporter permease n=1 Tax=Cytobacillus firmus TaxID=1399 RepID=UPI00204107AA|nr:sugar ABC transporter permease [Cytobacillus firmus]MCM3706945.1 sugar ABC transporter permease [Cytobacillus firmus]